MKKTTNRLALLALISSALIFILIANNLQADWIRAIDYGIISYLIKNTNYSLVLIAKGITLFANWQMIFLLGILLFIFINDKFIVLLINVSVAFSSLLNTVIKSYFQRARPNVMHLTSAAGFSFPSGHAMIATIFYGLIMILLVRKIKKRKSRQILYFILSILIVLISLSRVYLRVHFLSDVIAGMTLGMVVVTTIYQFKVNVFENIKTIVNSEDDIND